MTGSGFVADVEHISVSKETGLRSHDCRNCDMYLPCYMRRRDVKI